MTDDRSREDPPTGESLGRFATLYHVAFGALDRDPGAQSLDGARFIAADVATKTQGPERILVEYPSDEALVEAWGAVLFESPAHADQEGKS